MLYNYRLTHVRIGKVEADAANANKQNVGKYFIIGQLRNERFRNAAPTTLTVWQDDDPDLIQAVREIYPKEGKDSDGNAWNGLSDADAENFDPMEAEKLLRKYKEVDWLLYENGKRITAKLDGPYCMQYSTDLGNHKAGEWVCDPTGTYVKVWTEREIFVRMYDEANNQYMEGWSEAERLRSDMRRLVPLAVVVKMAPDKVDPRYLNGYNVPSVSAEAPADDEENR